MSILQNQRDTDQLSLRGLYLQKQLYENMKNHSPREYDNKIYVEIPKTQHEWLIDMAIEHLKNKLTNVK